PRWGNDPEKLRATPDLLIRGEKQSVSGKQDTSVNVGCGPYCYRLHGENYHLAGPLLPADGKPAKFAQLYIFDTENEIQNRIGAVSNGESSSSKNNELDYQLTTDIHELLDEIKPLVQDFRMAGERIRSLDDEKISLRLIVTRKRDGRQCNLPTASVVTALIVGDFDSTEHKRDIILHYQDSDFKRISKLHPSYLALHYPLFFPYGKDNYRSAIFQEGNDKDLRSETYSKLATLAQNSESGVKLRGKKVILNSNFTGSPRYMMQNYLDAMTLRKFYGYPDLFITFTCNPNWPEITRFMEKRGLKSEDRSDVISRAFKIKLDCLMKELNDMHIFGCVKGDEYISTEIPNKDEDLKLYQLVTDHMMHGPCGAGNPSCPCTIEYKCTKKFPRQFNETTVIDDSGYALYKRRNDGNIIKKSETDLHNGYVVPYNPRLLRRYQAHINVEWCNQVGSIKYLFKYINKGPDRVSTTIDGKEVDEIKDFLNYTYLSACETTWRIYGFKIHYRTPSIEMLSFHLKDEQQKQRIWALRKQGKSLGCIHHAPPSWGELYYLRAILNNVRGPMEWDDLKKVDDVLYPTYRDACYARGLLQDDKEYIDGILEASLCLTTKQKGIYSTVMDAVDNNKGGMFFVYGYGGTGKTYLYKTMLVALCSKGDIVLNVATSGIAALLSEGGRTSHSRFTIPINIVEDSMCYIAADSDLADLIRKANLIIWDEAPMINRHCYEAFDRTLQILPVITNGGRHDVLDQRNLKKEIQEFAYWILEIGNGKVGGANDGESTIVFPDNMLIPETDDDVGVIIDVTYPNLLQNLWNPSFFQEKAILAPTHEMVDIINERMLSLLLGDEDEYESIDSVSLADED
nr:uncharacterized protein [Tanacetum cinerariifolium]